MCLAAAVSELHMLEHLKHGVEHGQHDHFALHQRATIQGHPLRISGFCHVEAKTESENIWLRRLP